MELPASYYGKIDKRNPVIIAFERDLSSIVTLIRRTASSTRQDNSSYAKSIKTLVELWIKYKHRLPTKLYLEHMLQTADSLFELKLYQPALWHGYSLCLLQFSSVDITDITDVNHFMVCFFPEGFDAEKDTLAVKIRAMQGWALCILEQEKRQHVLSQNGLCKLLRVLNFIRIMMQAFQQHEHLCWHLYNGSLLMYSICRYLMTANCSSQALEYLLWASISLELSVPLMTAKYLPWIVTLYCAACRCYYDNQSGVQAEKFARRALGKINELAKLEEQCEGPATRETQRVYKEASIKLGAMVFKRAVFETRTKPKLVFKVKFKSTLKDTNTVPWPHTISGRILRNLFDSSAAHFFAIIEALWDSTGRPLKTCMPDEPEMQEGILELLSAGISILSGVATTSEQRCDDHPSMSLSAVTPTSTLIDLAIAGENKIPIMSAVRFIKLLYQYKQPEAFTELAREMLHVLHGVEGQSFRRVERELALLYSFNNLLCFQRRRPKDSTSDDQHTSLFSMSDEFIGVVETLHTSVCGCPPEVQPDEDLVLDVVLYLWVKLKLVWRENPELTHYTEKVEYYKWLWCLSLLWEIANVCDLATVDCIMMAEMVHILATHLESAAEHCDQTHCRASEADGGGAKPGYSSLLWSSRTDLLQREWEVVENGLKNLAKGVATLRPQDFAVITDAAFMLKFFLITPSTGKLPEDGIEEDEKNKTEEEAVETKAGSDIKSFKKTQPRRLQLASDLHLELVILRHRAFLKLLHLNAVVESELMDRIKKNKVSKALFLIQKAFVMYSNTEPNDSSKLKSLLEDSSSMIEKAEAEERLLHVSNTPKTPPKHRDKEMKEETPPPPPILLSRTDQAFIFAPAPYNLEGQVCWYQLCGRAAEGISRKVRLGDCSLLGTGYMVPVKPGECVLKAEGLEPNQKYVFAVAAYDSQGKLLGNSIGETTLPLLASMPVPLLSAWAHLAEVAFHTVQYAMAKRACRKLWSHYTFPDPGSRCTQNRLAATGLHKPTLRRSSPHLCQMFLKSIFIEAEINIQQESLYYDSFSDKGPFIWEKEARLAECDRLLVAMDLALWLNDGIAAIQAVVMCHGLLAPLIFHQIPCYAVVKVLKKCLLVLEENSGLLKQKWTGDTSESLMHMIACITYYLSKALRMLRDYPVAFVLMDCGRRLLQEVYDAHRHISSPASAASTKTDHAAVVGEMKIGLQLKALHANYKKIVASLTPDCEISCPVTGSVEPSILYDLISSSTLKDAYQNVMKLRHKLCFTEYAALLLQRSMEEGHPEFVLEWGHSILQVLCRRDEAMGLLTKPFNPNSQSKRRKSVQSVKGNQPLQNKNTTHEDVRKKAKQKLPQGLLQKVRTNREKVIVERLLNKMSYVVHRHKKLLQLRKICRDESASKSCLNYVMAQAHLALLHQELDKLHGGRLQHRYSQLNPLCFSLAYCGVLVRRNPQTQQSWEHEGDSFHSHLIDFVAAHKNGTQSEVISDDSAIEESCDEGEDPAELVEEQIDPYRHAATLVLESLNKAGLHLQRAMVLAHRGRHWTCLQWVCRTVWDQNCRMAFFVQRAAQLECPSVITAEQMRTTFTPLLKVATDLIMDMLNRLKLWSVYDSNMPEEDIGSSLQFSALVDDSTQVDLFWVRALVLHTLEQLHYSGKWESLAHLALLYNAYTRERYALIITPLLVHAQRRLLERIRLYGGPSVPQPHHVKTQKATGTEVTCRSYACSQLLSGSTLTCTKLPRKKAERANATPVAVAELKGAEMKDSMARVCVPLDIEDSLRCYRRALDRRSHCTEVFQHSRSLLLLLLAYTQPSFVVQLRHNPSFSHSTSLVDFSDVVMPAPSSQPCDRTAEDFSTPNACYSLPISPDHMPTVIAAYSTSIKYLQANGRVSLRVLALHEMGNLQFYSGDTRAAQSCWSDAVDCALQSSGTIKKWDGVSFGAGNLQQTLKQAGVWGCLQAAGLAAKIAQHIFTSDMSRRTKCCLLSAHLFKCVMWCSMAQPRADLQYATHSIGDELLPGVNLFSEPFRVCLDTTVTGLNFICHWLFTTGYHVTLLPMLALYLHFVGTLCRDVQSTVEGKILKIRVLTELCLFTEAVKEAVQLTRGIGVFLPDGYYVVKHSLHPMNMFYCNKSLLDNAKALEELVNGDIAPEIRTLYGSTLCLRFTLARIQLVLALSNAEHDPPVQDSAEGECCLSKTTPMNSERHKQDRLKAIGSSIKTDEPKVLDLSSKDKKLSQDRVKFLLLEAASSLLNSSLQLLTSCSCSEIENLELAIELNLLKANLYLQQGLAALSSEMAASSLVLLQSSPVITSQPKPGVQKPASELPRCRTVCIQDLKECSMSKPLPGDCPREAEVRERIGVPLWLRCRLALVHSLVAHIHATAALLPGKNVNEEAARVLQEGLNECVQWGDLDFQALFMVEGAELDAQRGRTDDSIAKLQEAVSLLTGRTCMPPRSILTLARATLLLHSLRSTQSTTFLKLTQELLKKQLRIFGQRVMLSDGKMCLSTPGLSNIYLPYLNILAQTSLQIEQSADKLKSPEED